MAESPKPSITRALLPSQKETYTFETHDLPVRFEGEGVLHTRSTWLDDERATTAHLDLEDETRGVSRDIQRKMYINTSGGYDVRDIFNLTATRTINDSEVPLRIVGEDHTFSLDYITTDEEVTGEEIDSVPLDEVTLEAPFDDLDFRSEIEYGVAWGPKAGDPWAEGTVNARKVDEGTELEYTITGHTTHHDKSLEDHLNHVLKNMGIEYRNVFSNYDTPL